MKSESVMNDAQKIVLRYLECLRCADVDGIDELFAPSALVESPLYGRREARGFFEELFSATETSQIELIEVFRGPRESAQVAAHFRYTWTMSNRERVVFDCVDLFRLIPDGPVRRNWFGLGAERPTWRIQELKIIYDTYEARPKFERAVGER